MEPKQQPAPVEGEDFYMEGAAVVFTARFLLARGRCCGSGCRHCPYEGDAGGGEALKLERDSDNARREVV